MSQQSRGPDPKWVAAQVADITKQYASTPSPSPIEQTKPTWQWMKGAIAFEGDIPSNTNPNLKYHVVVYWDGNATCACKGYGYHHTCSHIKLVKDVLNETGTSPRK